MKKLHWLFCVSTALLLTAPGLSRADLGCGSRGAERLEEHLHPGQSAATYRRMLSDMGYAVTVNGNTRDYVEYDITKEDQAYRVKIGLDPQTGRATHIDVTPGGGERAQTTMQHRSR
jgi:hypothetical protein